MNLKIWIQVHKYQLLTGLLMIALLAVVSCTTSAPSAPPTGPIGGGCG